MSIILHLFFSYISTQTHTHTHTHHSQQSLSRVFPPVWGRSVRHSARWPTCTRTAQTCLHTLHRGSIYPSTGCPVCGWQSPLAGSEVGVSEPLISGAIRPSTRMFDCIYRCLKIGQCVSSVLLEICETFCCIFDI